MSWNGIQDSFMRLQRPVCIFRCVFLFVFLPVNKNLISDWYISFNFFPVIESHPDNALEDLRLDQPFDEFKDHVQSYDLDSMEKKVFALLTELICLCAFVSLNYVTFTYLVVIITLFIFFPCVGSQSYTVDYSYG